MVEIGVGRRPETEMSALLALDHNHQTASPAPAAGLSFVEAWYPDAIWVGPEVCW
jgi:tRNA U38,U39,U40 pseudouridine synthase TruA